MLTFEQMVVRLIIALLLGAILGFERELVGKEAGVRTDMLVAGGAAIFSMIGLSLPYISASSIGLLPDIGTINAGLGVIANIVIGIGFLGAGLIIKTNEHPHGVTTAALVWATAAIGVLVGIGLIQFAIVAAVFIAILLYVLRKLNVNESIEGKKK
jgi:putative Mg2+ transporter-C (MgtC) family protein